MPTCAECGFLAFRQGTIRELVEAEESFRKTGKVPVNRSGHVLYEDVPLCFRRAADIRKEVGNPTVKALLDTIQEQRDCESFTDWQQGFTPKEHAEMIQEKARLEWQREREEADRQWREEQSVSEHDWRERQEAIATQREEVREGNTVKRHRWNLSFILLGALLGALIGVAGALGAVWLAKEIVKPVPAIEAPSPAPDVLDGE